MGIYRFQESEISIDSKHSDEKFVIRAISKLPLQEMGLEQYNEVRKYICKLGRMDCIEVFPEDNVLHSIWIPPNAQKAHSTEEYQAFTIDGVDYFIYRRPKNHVRKVLVYN